MTNWRSRPLALVLSIALLLLTKALIGGDHPWVAVECAIELALLACPAWAWSDGPPRAVWQAGALSRGNVEELGVGTPGQPTVMSGSAMIRGAVMALKKPSAATAVDD